MTNPTSLLVQTLTAATQSFPIPHINTCMGFLCQTLGHAGFEHASVSENPAFGCAVECDRSEHHHVIPVLILSPDAYEMTQDEVSDFARAILDADEHLDDLKRELGDSVLDVASVCLDPINGRCRIHHPQDILETCQLHEQPVHFFIPAGTDKPIPADEYPESLGEVLDDLRRLFRKPSSQKRGPELGYHSDFQGEIRATFADIDTAAKALDELRRREVSDRSGFACMFEFRRDEADIVASVDMFDTWYDSESDTTALVDWFADHGATSVNGDVEVIGETPRDDMWRIHVTDGVVTTQDGHIVYEEA